MAVNGLSGSYYQYQNTLNMLQLSNARQTSRYQAVEPVNRVSSAAYSSGCHDFLRSYQKELTSLESAAFKLKESSSKNVFNDYQAASTNSKVAEVSGTYSLKGDTDISLNVQSLAQAQQNTSAAHVGAEEVSLGDDMNFEIMTGDGKRVSVSIGSTNEDGTTKTYHQMYQEAAQSINAQAGSSVKASVANVEGKVSLVLTSGKEGEAGGFSVSGETGAAAGVERASVFAQDAVYSVTENGITTEFQSASNRISLDYGRIEVQLKGTGESRIYTGIDEDEVVSAVKDLVNGYNSVQSLLQGNSDRGTGAAAHAQAFGRGMADEKTLAAIGISYNKDGKLQLDEKELREALETDFDGTKSIIGGQFGIAEKVAARSDAALSDSVQRIVSNDLKGTAEKGTTSSQKQNYDRSMYQYFYNFAKSSPYNLGNYYAVGMLMNTLA